VGGPTVEYADGSTEWYLEGQLHRVDGPAVEYADGNKFWYFKNELHRLDGPAIEWSDGRVCWYLEGKLHMSYEQYLLSRRVPLYTDVRLLIIGSSLYIYRVYTLQSICLPDAIDTFLERQQRRSAAAAISKPDAASASSSGSNNN